MSVSPSNFYAPRLSKAARVGYGKYAMCLFQAKMMVCLPSPSVSMVNDFLPERGLVFTESATLVDAQGVAYAKIFVSPSPSPCA